MTLPELTPIMLLALALILTGTVLYALAYQKHVRHWSPEERRSFLLSAGGNGVIALASLFVIQQAGQAADQQIAALSHVQAADPRIVRYYELMGTCLQSFSLLLTASLPFRGAQLLLGKKPQSLSPEAEEDLSPKEDFHKTLPQMVFGIAGLLLLAVASEIISERSTFQLTNGGMATTMYIGLALTILGLLLQGYSSAYPERGNPALYGGGLVSTVGFGLVLVLPTVQQAPGRTDLLLMTALISLGMGLALPVRMYLDGRKQTS
ncbi:hypothetical protein [Deinococcus proteolyticus]|nr:hypothetical protein [Deinococcus proteolyticus]